MTIRVFFLPAFCAVFLFFVHPFVRAETAPVGICLFGENEYPGADDAVCGIRFGFFGQHRRMDGLSVLLFGNDCFPIFGEDGSAGGVQLSSVFNLAGGTDGLLIQIVGFCNTVKDGTDGLNVQIAGLINGLGRGGFAIQASPFFNWAATEDAVFQIAGLYNQLEGGFFAFQASPFVNRAATEGVAFQVAAGNNAENLAGVQFGGLNLSGRGSGIQVGIYNECAGRTFWTDREKRLVDGDNLVFNGAQIGGINRALDANGAQIGGINRALDANGFQIGAVNASETVDGVQIGVVNWADSVSGLQLAAANLAHEDCSGVQLGAMNLAGRLHGLQLGVFNAALSECKGAQIGLFNVYSGSRADISAVQFGVANAAGGSAMVVLPVLRVVF